MVRIAAVVAILAAAERNNREVRKVSFWVPARASAGDRRHFRDRPSRRLTE